MRETEDSHRLPRDVVEISIFYIFLLSLEILKIPLDMVLGK